LKHGLHFTRKKKVAEFWNVTLYCPLDISEERVPTIFRAEKKPNKKPACSRQ
jgi:hypothetical protein